MRLEKWLFSTVNRKIIAVEKKWQNGYFFSKCPIDISLSKIYKLMCSTCLIYVDLFSKTSIVRQSIQDRSIPFVILPAI